MRPVKWLVIGILCIGVIMSVPAHGQAAKPLVIVCSTTQVADFARQVVGDRCVVQCILAPGADPHTVSYLDDLLIHPTTGPHGKEIPEDEGAVVRKEPISLSSLRPGRWAEVIGREKVPSSIGPGIGRKIMVKERQNQGALWVIVAENGDEYHLNHDEADEIWVRLD